MAAPPCQTCAHTGDWHPSNGACQGYDATLTPGPPIQLCGCAAYVSGVAPVPVPFICPICRTVTTNPVDVAQRYCTVCDGWTGDRISRLVHWEVGPPWNR